MFENVINPSAEGRWIRVAPYLTLSAIVALFFMALMVVVSSVRTGYYLTTQSPQEPTRVQPAALVQTSSEVFHPAPNRAIWPPPLPPGTGTRLR